MYKKIRLWIQTQMSFSSREANGFVIIIFVVGICLATPLFIDLFWKPASYNISKDQALLDSLMLKLSSAPATKTYKFKNKYSEVIQINSFPFDPNTAPEEVLLKLGLPQKIVSNIIKFRSKGGKFKVKKDFAKIYGLGQDMYSKLEQNIQLPDSSTFKKEYKKTFPKTVYTQISFDINTADTTALIALRGIGGKLAGRIIKFRDGLGGIINLDQYKEIYGLDSVALKSLHEQTFVSKNFHPKKINLKTATLMELQTHPYLSRKEAQIIFNFIKQHPEISSPKDLEGIRVISKEKRDMLMPYLLIE